MQEHLFYGYIYLLRSVSFTCTTRVQGVLLQKRQPAWFAERESVTARLLGIPTESSYITTAAKIALSYRWQQRDDVN